jgi:GNAT superfamily N-acetyltransferase
VKTQTEGAGQPDCLGLGADRSRSAGKCQSTEDLELLAPQYCRVTVTLRHPGAEEYAARSAAALDAYVDEIVASGSMSREAAEEKGRRDGAEVLPEGLATPGRLIFRVVVDGRPVGWLWLALRNPRAEAGVGFIYDITVDEALRGRGYGRAAMHLADSGDGGVSSITAARRLIGCFQRHWHTNWHTMACRSLSARETVGRVHAENPLCIKRMLGGEGGIRTHGGY